MKREDFNLPVVGKLHTTSEAAAIMRIKPQTMRLMISRGRVTVVRIGRAVRVPSAALHDLIARGFSKGTP